MIFEDNMRDLINLKLERLERLNNVKVIFACESGSRAWGFASDNSDWDVRFIYYHKLDWYLSIQKTRNVIEYNDPFNKLDMVGWDIKKVLNLMYKSNPQLIEWIESTIVYQKDLINFNKLVYESHNYYSPRACHYHYYNMANSNYREYLKGDIVKLKKYLYVIRPLLACMWIDKFRNMHVPINIYELIHKLKKYLYGSFTDVLYELLKKKRNGDELCSGQKLITLDFFIGESLDRYRGDIDYDKSQNENKDALDILFRNIVNKKGGGCKCLV